MRCNDWSDLVREAQKNDQKSLRQLIGAIHQEIFQFCLYLTKNKEMAEDLTQESLLKVIEKLNQLKEPKKFPTWVKQIAKRQFLDHRRSAYYKKTQFEGLGLEDLIQHSSESMDHEDQSHLKVLAIDALRALEKLPHQDQLIIILADIQSHSYEEIAEILEIKVGTVKSRLNRVRKDFSENFEQNVLQIRPIS